MTPEHDHDHEHEIEFTLNDEPVEASVPSHWTLATLLRDELNMTGTTEGCGVGVCGSCTVLVDGSTVSSCLELAANVDGREVRTVEGLAESYPHADRHPLQESFEAFEAFQCGYCTPGMLMSAAALLEEDPDPDREAIEHYLSENLCRCTGYKPIVTAVEEAAKAME